MTKGNQTLDSTWLVIAALIGLATVSSAIWISTQTEDDLKFRGMEIPDFSGKAVTVLGPIDPNSLGQTLMHEHLKIFFWIPLDETARWKKWGGEPPSTKEELAIWEETFTLINKDELIDDKFRIRNKDAYTLLPEDTLPEIMAFKTQGGATIVDMPPIEKARDAPALVALSRKSGVNIIAASSFYTAAWHPENIDSLSVDDLTEVMVRDVVEGMDGTGIKAGLIGETPANNLLLSPLENNEARILRAAARASRLTGAALSLHTSFKESDEKLHQALDLIAEEGVAPNRTIVGHAQIYRENSQDRFLSLLARGVVLEFDTLGGDSQDNEELAEAILLLIKAGFGKQLLVSQDIYGKFHLTKFDGRGLTYIHNILIPFLQKEGVSDADIKQIMEHNPRRLLTFTKPQKQIISKN